MAYCNEMSDNTVCYYNRFADDFADDTASADVSSILNEFTALLPEDALVLDWGCGTGRDSRLMSDMGVSVVSVDASSAMCQKAKELFGVDPSCESFDELDAEDVFDGIWACASLLHVEKKFLQGAFQKACRALKPQGVFYTSFKLGNFEGVRRGRWYTDLDEKSLATLLHPEFDIVRMWVTGDVRPGRAEEKWLNCLSRKHS